MTRVIVTVLAAAFGVAVHVPPTAPLWTWRAEDLPFTIIVDADIADWEPDIAEAALWWNTRLGRTVFLPPGELGAGAIVAVLPYTVKDGMVGRTNHSGHMCGVRL